MNSIKFTPLILKMCYILSLIVLLMFVYVNFFKTKNNFYSGLDGHVDDHYHINDVPTNFPKTT